MVQFSLMSVRRPITEWLIREPALQWHQGLLKFMEAGMQGSRSRLQELAFRPGFLCGWAGARKPGARKPTFSLLVLQAKGLT